MISAVRQYTVFDYSSTFIAFLFFAMPVFWFAVLLKEFGAIKLNNWLATPGHLVLRPSSSCRLRRGRVHHLQHRREAVPSAGPDRAAVGVALASCSSP